MHKLALICLLLMMAAGCNADVSQQHPDPTAEMTACEEPRPQACTLEYMPVCGQRDTGIRCVTTPCDSHEWQTYSNGCAACGDPKVAGYIADECPDET